MRGKKTNEMKSKLKKWWKDELYKQYKLKLQNLSSWLYVICYEDPLLLWSIFNLNLTVTKFVTLYIMGLTYVSTNSIWIMGLTYVSTNSIWTMGLTYVSTNSIWRQTLTVLWNSYSFLRRKELVCNNIARDDHLAKPNELELNYFINKLDYIHDVQKKVKDEKYSPSIPIIIIRNYNLKKDVESFVDSHPILSELHVINKEQLLSRLVDDDNNLVLYPEFMFLHSNKNIVNQYFSKYDDDTVFCDATLRYSTKMENDDLHSGSISLIYPLPNKNFIDQRMATLSLENAYQFMSISSLFSRSNSDKVSKHTEPCLNDLDPDINRSSISYNDKKLDPDPNNTKNVLSLGSTLKSGHKTMLKPNNSTKQPKRFHLSYVRDNRVRQNVEEFLDQSYENGLLLSKFRSEPHVFWPSSHPLLQYIFRSLKKCVGYSDYDKRLQSFLLKNNRRKQNWPDSNTVRPEPLINAGFSYDGNGAEVVCKSCGYLSSTDVWSDDDEEYAMDIHRRTKQNCSFLKKNSSQRNLKGRKQTNGKDSIVQNLHSYLRNSDAIGNVNQCSADTAIEYFDNHDGNTFVPDDIAFNRFKQYTMVQSTKRRYFDLENNNDFLHEKINSWRCVSCGLAKAYFDESEVMTVHTLGQLDDSSLKKYMEKDKMKFAQINWKQQTMLAEDRFFLSVGYPYIIRSFQYGGGFLYPGSIYALLKMNAKLCKCQTDAKGKKHIQNIGKKTQVLKEEEFKRAKSKENKESRGKFMCVRCKFEPCNSINIPCGHRRYCRSCSDKIDFCDYCNVKIIRSYFEDII